MKVLCTGSLLKSAKPSCATALVFLRALLVKIFNHKDEPVRWAALPT
ncbi:hypothetical protein JYQ62_37070 [Nostoc sp. UHCC 0702]|nr:hypothetical protein JYQ62_37070 [Nostoc sp. UHCC 0702]